MLKRQAGMGLVELMVGLAVGMVVVVAAMSLLTTTLSNSNDNIKMARVEQELRQVMQMVSRDLRRATSWDAATDVTQVSMTIPLTLSANSGSVTVSTSASDGSGIDHLADIGDKALNGTLLYVDGDAVAYTGTITAYSSGTYTVTLNGTWPTTVTDTDGISELSWSILRPESQITYTGSCLLIPFDSNLNGKIDTNEYIGYRLNGGAVQVRYSGANTDTCSSGGTWEALTDSNFMTVNSFSVTDNSPASTTNSGLTVSVREFTISISGTLNADSTISRNIQETIRVRNDRVS